MDKILAAKEILRCAQNDGIADTSEVGGHVERSETSIWEKQIDTLVYKLYGLSAEEIAVVEKC